MQRSSSTDDLTGMPRGATPRGPAGPAASAAERDLLAQAVALHLPDIPAEVPGGSASALLPILHHIQDALGFVPQALVPEIARELSLSRAEVHGAITYYHHFRSAPAGRHVVQICQAEACRANGAEALMAHASARLACAPGHTRADGAVTLEPVYCLGLCATGPSALVDDRLRARVSAATVDDWAARFEGTAP
jgi:formate dehydrogenase subunit gamma